MSGDKTTQNFEGKLFRIDGENPASTVAEYSPTSDMYITYTRFDDGTVTVEGTVKGTGVNTRVNLYPDGRIVILNPQIPRISAFTSTEAPEATRLILELIDGAFPKGASEIVPIGERKSGSPVDMLAFSGKTLKDVNFIAQGNGYTVRSQDGDVTFHQLDADGNITATLFAGSRAIIYDDPQVIDELEPVVLDALNTTERNASINNVLLAGRVLADGIIDAKEAKEIGEAMQRARTATEVELQRDSRKI